MRTSIVEPYRVLELPGAYTIHHPRDPWRIHGFTAARSDASIRRAALRAAIRCECIGATIVYRDTAGHPQTLTPKETSCRAGK